MQHPLLGALALAAGATTVHASAPQTPELRYSVGALQGTELGFELDVLGDVTGDGFPDLVVGARRDRDPATGLIGLGSVRTYDGRTGEQLSLVYPPDGVTEMGSMVRNLGDVNNDGVVDYGAGSEQVPSLVIYSGADHSVLHVWSGGSVFFGREFDAMGDWNGDGFDDVAIVEFKNISNPGSVQIRSGLDGAVLAQVTPSASPFGWFGVSMRTLDDLNGDGVREVVVGASGSQGQVLIYSGADLSLWSTLLPPAGTTNLGFSVGDAGDIDGDGLPDIAAGAPQDQANAGSITIFSGATGAVLHHVQGAPGERLGYAASGIGDVNGDGVPDFGGGGESAKLFSGVDGALLQTYSVPGSLFRALAPLGDVNGDGLAEVAFGNFTWPNPNGGGGLMAMSAQAADAYGAEPSSTQTLTAAWQPAQAGPPTQGKIRISGAAPASTGVVFAYTQPADLPEYAPGLRLWIDPLSTPLFSSFFAFDGAGQIEIPVDLALPGAAGAHFYTQTFQVGAATPSGVHSSNGLLLLFQE
jgi:hypothetical protein